MLLQRVRRRTMGSVAPRWARWNMERHGLNRLFALRPKDAKPPQAYDLWNLYTNVRSRRPALTLELGCGCSTIVMAEAMRRNGCGNLIVMEANKRWIDASRKELPRHLHNVVEFRYSPLTKIEIGGEACHVYSDLPPYTIDLLYLDGPDPADVPEWRVPGDPISADPVTLEQQFNPRFRMIVDSRKANVAFLKRQLTRDYRAATNKMFGVTTFDLQAGSSP